MMMNQEEKMKTLPHELHVEILTWLPAKSLVSFKSVCKPWHTLVNNPDFIKLHLTRANADERHSLICGYCGDEFYQLKAPYYDTAIPLLQKHTDISFLFKSYTVRASLILAGSRNGLLCFGFNFDESKRRWTGLVIMNPATRRYRVLPEEPPDHYDDDSWVPIYGLGYSSVLDDYKVVRISCSERDPRKSAEVKVYSMSTKSWRRARDNPYTIRWPTSTEEFLNEAFHWMGAKKDANRIISFNICEEMFREVPAPVDCLIDQNKRYEVMILRGCLCMMISSTSDRPCDYEIWAMKEYGVQESWTRQFVIRNHYYPLYKIFNPSMIRLNNGQLPIRGGNRDLFFYDMKKTRTISEVAEDKFIRIRGLTVYRLEDCTYIESLVSLKSKETTATS